MTSRNSNTFDTRQPLFSESKWVPTSRNNQGRTRTVKPLASHIETVTKPVLGKRGFTSHRILSHWGDVVGDHLAQQCTPDRIRFNKGSRIDGTLYIHAYGVQAMELEYLKLQVIQQVNTYCGYHAIGDIKIIQTPLKQTQNLIPSPKKPNVLPLDNQQNAVLEAQLSDMADGSLKTALERLGRTVMGHVKE